MQHDSVCVRAGLSATRGWSMAADGSQVPAVEELPESSATGSADVIDVLSSGEEDKQATAV